MSQVSQGARPGLESRPPNAQGFSIPVTTAGARAGNPRRLARVEGYRQPGVGAASSAGGERLSSRAVPEPERQVPGKEVPPPPRDSA